MHASNQKQEINRKLNRKLNRNGTGTKLQWPNNNYYMYAWMQKQ